MRQDFRQSRFYGVLSQVLPFLTFQSGDTVLSSIDGELTPPLRVDATSSPSHVVNIGPSIVSNTNSGRNKAFAFVNSNMLNLTSATVTFPSSNGGNIVASTGATLALTCPSGQFVKVLLCIDGSAAIQIAQGSAAGTSSGASVPSPIANTQPFAFVTVSNVSGTIQNIAQTAIYQLPESGVTTGSTGAIPTGVIQAFGGSSAPTGFLLCDGSAVSRSSFSSLFAVIGTNFGSGDGTTTFNVPDTRYKFLRGYGPNTTASGTGIAAAAAKFIGTAPGTATSVTITANNVGTAGNSITITGNGTLNYTGLISAYNSANPSNQVTFTSGTATQVPNNGAVLTFTGGVDPSTTVNVAAHFTGTVGGLTTSVTVTAVTAGANGNKINLVGNGSSTVNALITAWNSANPTNTATLSSGVGTQVPGNFQTMTLAGGLNSTATFTAHGFINTGLQVRLSSGTLTGLSTSTDYWLIVVDANTLSFSTTRANALNNIAINLTGTNSGTVEQFMDPDITTRAANVPGGATGANIGSYEEDALQAHRHQFGNGTGGSIYGNPNGFQDSLSGAAVGDPVASPGNGAIRTSSETRPRNLYVNYIIAI